MTEAGAAGSAYLLCTGRGVSWAGGRTPSLDLPGVKANWARAPTLGPRRARGQCGPCGPRVTAVKARSKARRRVLARKGRLQRATAGGAHTRQGKDSRGRSAGSSGPHLPGPRKRHSPGLSLALRQAVTHKHSLRDCVLASPSSIRPGGRGR